MFEIRLDDEEMKEDTEKEKEERREEEEEEEVSDGRQKKEEVSLSVSLSQLLFFSLFLSLCPRLPRTGSGPSEPDSELPGGGGVEAQGLVRGEEGVEPEDSSDSAGCTRQHGRQLRLQHRCRG